MNETMQLVVTVCLLTVCTALTLGILTCVVLFMRLVTRELRENKGPTTYWYSSTGTCASTGTGGGYTVIWPAPQPPPTTASVPDVEVEAAPAAEEKSEPEPPQSSCPKCQKVMAMTGTGSDETGNHFYWYECSCGYKHCLKGPPLT
jgi:hypothetical protein